MLARIADELGLPWDERDVTVDDSLYEQFGDRIPVVLLDAREHSYWSVDEPRLRRDVAR